MKYTIDGDQVCCTNLDFIDLNYSHAGFGDSLKEAFINYWSTTPEKMKLNDLNDWELPWVDLIGERPEVLPEGEKFDKAYKQRQLDMIALGGVRLMNANEMNPMIAVRSMEGFEFICFTLAINEADADEAMKYLRKALIKTSKLTGSLKEENLVDHVDTNVIH